VDLPSVLPSWSAYALALFGAFCLGISKTGFPGLAIVNVLVIAELFGAKNSVGIVLPLLVLCDLVVYPLFRKWASWREVVHLLFPTAVGLALGWFVLGRIDDETARRTIGVVILVMLLLQLFREKRGELLKNLPDSSSFLWGSGAFIGISTMLANAAGPVYSIYALVRRYPKEIFLGIGARFFLLVNLVKIPMLGQLDLINRSSLLIDLLLVPGILAGILVGRKVIGCIPQKTFEWLLYFFAVVAGLWMLFGTRLSGGG